MILWITICEIRHCIMIKDECNTSEKIKSLGNFIREICYEMNSSKTVNMNRLRRRLNDAALLTLAMHKIINKRYKHDSPGNRKKKNT